MLQLWYKPYVHTYWNTYFNTIINWENVYKALHSLNDNRVKQFKFKLINKIVPSKEIRFTWNIAQTPLCNSCNKIESYEHLFIECQEITNFWKKVTEMFTYCGISTNMKRLKNIVIGYKVNNQEYTVVNEILAITGFSIYKTYFISETRSKKIDSFISFCNEIRALVNL